MEQAPNKIYYCYKATNKVNGKVYIGFAADPLTRWRNHKQDANKGKGYAFHAAIRKHGWEAFEFEVICCGKDKRDMLEHTEPTLIDQYQSLIIQNGYNMYRKRGGVLEEAIRKISKVNGQTWFIRFPDTHIEKIFSMNAFCEKHNLSISAMSKISGSGIPHKGFRCAKSLLELEKIVEPYAQQKKKRSQEHIMKVVETRLKTGCMKGHVSPMKGKNHTDAAKEQNRLKHLGKFSNAVDRYRIGDHKFRTIQQIARFLHVSTEKVRQKIVNGEIKDSTFTLHTNGGQQLRGDNPSHLYGAMMQAK